MTKSPGLRTLVLPITSNKTAADKAKNRRTEFTLMSGTR